MSRKYIYVIFLFAAYFNTAYAQKTFVGFDTGFGTYRMDENKLIIESIMRNYSFRPQPVSNFPGYLFFRTYIGIEYQYLNVGLAYTLMSTGTRYSMHDYSGDYKFDTQIVGNSAGVFIEIPVYSFKNYKFYIASEGGLILNKMKLDESLQLIDVYNQQENTNLKSTNFFIKPYLKVDYSIAKNISANIVIGYHKDLVANNMYLVDDNTMVSNFKADWEGIRTSIGVSYKFD
jgi:hypothetical protein